MFSSGNNSLSLLFFFFFSLLCIVLPRPFPRCCELWSLASNCYLFFCQLDATPYGSRELKMETVKINASPPSHCSPNPPTLTQPATMSLLKTCMFGLFGSQAKPNLCLFNIISAGICFDALKFCCMLSRKAKHVSRVNNTPTALTVSAFTGGINVKARQWSVPAVHSGECSFIRFCTT